MMSQVQVIGLPRPKTWADYENGCLATFGGGHRGDELDAFQHGMQTVFNLLRSEFPPAEQCKAAPQLVAALEAVVYAYDVDGDCLRSADLERCRAVAEVAPGSDAIKIEVISSSGIEGNDNE